MEQKNETALFNPLNGQLEQLFGYIDMGDLGLPDIQRPFVWEDAKVRNLFDSLYKGFPIGSYLFWRNDLGGKSHQIGTTKREHKDPNILIIDGQQRLTALYAVFRSKLVKDEDYSDRKIAISFNPLSEEFRVADATTERNKEFINDISDLFMQSSTRTFINTFLTTLAKEKGNVQKRFHEIFEKIKSNKFLNKTEAGFVEEKLKGFISEESLLIKEKLGFDKPSDENLEDEEDGVDDNEDENIEDIFNSRVRHLTKSELKILGDLLTQEHVLDEDLISSRIERLYGLKNYPFNALEIKPSLTEAQVAEIFTRINSAGTPLKQADFILTLLSVFWREGRQSIDEFCMRAKKVSDREEKVSPFNYIFQPTPKDLVRIIVGIGFSRGKMRDAYLILSGRDFASKKLSTDLRDKNFEHFKEAQKTSLDLLNWHGFLKVIMGLGFKHMSLIASSNNIANAYILYLIAKSKYGLDHRELERYIGRWFFFSSITSRYTFSPESQMESDLRYFAEAANKKEFEEAIDQLLNNEITDDYWKINVPNSELVSSSKRNAIRQAYFACLIRNNVNVLFSKRKISDLFNPDLKPVRKNLEKHHIFPKDYLASTFKLTRRLINQTANFTYLEYEDNVDISNEAPKDYFPVLSKAAYKSEVELNQAMKEHCLPDKFYNLEYEEFLKSRRTMISNYVRETFEDL